MGTGAFMSSCPTFGTSGRLSVGVADRNAIALSIATPGMWERKAVTRACDLVVPS
jgi:hypothetical protein